jgi:hypothetical protein
VPEGVLPAYCGSWFPNEHIIDFMNLPAALSCSDRYRH